MTRPIWASVIDDRPNCAECRKPAGFRIHEVDARTCGPNCPAPNEHHLYREPTWRDRVRDSRLYRAIFG